MRKNSSSQASDDSGLNFKVRMRGAASPPTYVNDCIPEAKVPRGHFSFAKKAMGIGTQEDRKRVGVRGRSMVVIEYRLPLLAALGGEVRKRLKGG